MSDIAAYYDRLALEHGHTPQAVDAPNQHALQLRYEALGDGADMNGKRVLEVGCGYGGLGAYLTHRYPKIEYRGIDVSRNLITIGEQAHPELRLYWANILSLPLTRRYDIVLAQGLFYKLGVGAWPKTQALIGKMYAHADELCAFTAITNHVAAESGEFRIDAMKTLAACKTVAPRVVYRHDYHPGDALFILHRKEA